MKNNKNRIETERLQKKNKVESNACIKINQKI